MTKQEQLRQPDEKGYIHAHGIFIPGKDSKPGVWYAGGGRVTRRRVHVPLARTVAELENMERVAKELGELNPDDTFEVRAL
jgi:hypothetical protein